jgi:hypothetical protein
MPSDQFSQLASSVPGTSALVDEATKAGLPAANNCTGLVEPNADAVEGWHQPAMVSQLVPALTKAVTSGGGRRSRAFRCA